MGFVELLKEADEIVRNKPTWKQFIDGTPLSNDLAVWMAMFAQDKADLVAAAEREACAKVCESQYISDGSNEDVAAIRCAAAIRARGKK